MSRGSRITLWLALFALLAPQLLPASAKTARKPPAKKAPAPPVEEPRPPLPQELPAVPPTVTYSDGQLTIVAENSTLQDILTGVRKATGATVDAPASSAGERVATRLGPGTPREVLAALLNGSRFDYILLSPAENPGGVRRLILSPRSGSGAAAADTSGSSAGASFSQPARPVPAVRPQPADINDTEDAAPEETVEPAEQVPPEAPAPMVPPEVKTPQQIQEELLRRQEEERQQQLEHQQQEQPQ